MMSWVSRELAIPHGTHFATQGLLAHRDAELFPNPLGQITQTPSDDAIKLRRRSALDGLRQGRSLFVVQKRTLSRSLAVDRPSGPRVLKRTTQSRTI
jgi:hypothetical protein